MSYLVARMQKMKSQNLGGIQKHNQREFENHSNTEIDKTRSHLNFDLVNPDKIDYREKIMNTINEQKKSTRKTRKDAVLVNEWIVTSDNNFFEGLDQHQTEEFFKVSSDFFKDRYGSQNLAYSQVHLDETTPHMHLGVIPMRDGKLQAKNVFNRKELLAIQEEFPRFLKKKGFNLERGMPNGERKHLTVNEFKDMQSKLYKMAQVEEEKESHVQVLKEKEFSLKKKIEGSKRYLEYRAYLPPKAKQYKLKDKSVIYGLSQADYERLNAVRESVNDVLSENKRLEEENKILKEDNRYLRNRIEVLDKAQNQMSTILKTAQNHASNFSKGLFERAITYAKQFNKDDRIVEREKNKILGNVNESKEGFKDYEDWKNKRNNQKRMYFERE